MIDTHCHLADPVFADSIQEVVVAARDAGVDRFVVPSVDVGSSADSISCCRSIDGAVAAIGIHPMWGRFESRAGMELAVAQVAALAQENNDIVAAIGEIGLDPNLLPNLDNGRGTRPDCGRDNWLRPSIDLMMAQMELARTLDLPVLLHFRGRIEGAPGPSISFDALVDSLERFGPVRSGGILHAFNGSDQVAARLRGLGWLRGVAGTVSRPSATRLAAFIARTPLTDIVLETDAPFLANSVHKRGHVVPADLVTVAEAVANLHGVSFDHVVRQTDINAESLFGRQASTKWRIS